MKVEYCYKAYATQGNKVHIESFMKAYAALGEEVIDGGITVAPFTEDKSKWSLSKKLMAKMIWIGWNISHLLRLSQLALQSRPDVLLFRFTHDMSLAIFCLSFFYPVVLEVNATRSIEAPSTWSGLAGMLDKLLFRRAKRCFVVSSVVKDHIVSRSLMAGERIAVIENGVDLEMFAADTSSDKVKASFNIENCFVAGFVGSFQSYHGIENIISLAEAVKSESLNILFLIVGDGKERKRYEEMVRRKGLEKDVIFAGFVSHERVRDYIAVMDVALAPHRRDSFAESGGFHGSPLKIFEYMAMAKPIIAAPLGQIKELIVDGESGLLIYSEDTAALKEALLNLYHDKAFRERLGANARRRVEENYTWRANAEKVRDLCRDSLKADSL
jgi:glycosyltransferase involved in cell wall biosynthesis